MKNVHLVPVLILCGLSSACSLSPECRGYFDLATIYVNKLEATGRFSPDKIDCFRRHYAKLESPYHTLWFHALNPDSEKVNRGCRAGQLATEGLIKKTEEIPNLSQEEFDADWGKMWCGA
jgi:hypothetical protein